MKSIRLRYWIGVAALFWALSPAHALVFAINEGVTYRVPYSEIRERYAAIASDLSQILQQPVTILPVTDYPTLRRGLADRSYELAMVHPAHISILAMKNWGYRLVVVTKGFQTYSANFLVKTDSPLKTMNELRGTKMGAPDEDSITSWMVRATLRDVGISSDQVRIYYTRYQDAVPFFVDNDLTHTGATAASGVIKNWTGRGGRVLGKSRAVPIKHVIASPVMSPTQVEKVRQYLSGLDSSEEGKKKLAPTKWQGFEPYDAEAMMALGVWLGL
ncbi:MAG: PhnD/SsuA/transferrin family substrate-binding protein [Pseudomonadota bacterium]